MCSNTSKTQSVYFQLVLVLLYWHALYIVFKVLCQWCLCAQIKQGATQTLILMHVGNREQPRCKCNVQCSKRDEAEVINISGTRRVSENQALLSVNIVSIYGPRYDSLSRKKSILLPFSPDSKSSVDFKSINRGIMECML